MALPLPIYQAAERGDTEAIQEWFSTGTRNPDALHQLAIRTLLHPAAIQGHCDVIRLVLAHGATIDAEDIFRETPLHFAARYGKHDAAVLLLERGAQLEVRSSHLSTPLISAARSGHCDMIRLLLRRGANLDARDNNDENAETHAHYCGHTEAAALLADVRLAGGWGSFVRVPRKRVLALRILCERGRASTSGALLARLFPYHAPVEQDDDATDEPPPLLARAPQGPREVPKEVFWLVFEFWRCVSHDSPY